MRAAWFGLTATCAGSSICVGTSVVHATTAQRHIVANDNFSGSLGRWIGEVVRQNGFEPAYERLVVHCDERWNSDDVTRDGDTEQLGADERRPFGGSVDRHVGQRRRDLPRE